MTKSPVVQKVNLYQAMPHKLKVVLPVKLLFVLCGAFLVALLGYYGYWSWQKGKLNSQSIILQAKQQQLTNNLLQMSKNLPKISGASREQEALYKQQIMLKTKMLEYLYEKKNISRDGFFRYFYLFAKMAVPQVWLTDIEINRADHSAILKGSAFDLTAVLQYMKKLNSDKLFNDAPLSLHAVHKNTDSTKPIVFILRTHQEKTK